MAVILSHLSINSPCENLDANVGDLFEEIGLKPAIVVRMVRMIGNL